MNPRKTFIIAEAGVNHNGCLDMAKRLLAMAAQCGCDAVKFQTFRADRVASRLAGKCPYQANGTGGAESQYEMIHRLELDEEAHRELMALAQDAGIEFISTPFDEESATFLAHLGVHRLKIPSGEISNAPFLAHVARLRKPLLLSTGMAYLSEVDEAIRIIQGEWGEMGEPENGVPLTLLHCTSEYPAPLEEVNLRAMETLRNAFHLPVGYSDHTLGIEVSLAAVAMGATVIEKHFTLDRNLPGPDHKASLEPLELKQLVEGIRHIEVALGDGRKIPMPSEIKNRELVRKSLVATRDLPFGHRLMPGDLMAKRPGNGLSPKLKGTVIGAVLQKEIPRDGILTWEHLLERKEKGTVPIPW